MPPRSATTRSSAPTREAAKRWEALVDGARKAGSSLGAVIACEAFGVPAGWGAPLYAKLDSELAAACMSINAVKGVEIGDGFAAAALTGEQNADPMRPGNDGGPVFLANHAGGIAGGISTGQPVRVRVAFKPTSSILTPVETVTREGEATEIMTKGVTTPVSASAECRWSRRWSRWCSPIRSCSTARKWAELVPPGPDQLRSCPWRSSRRASQDRDASAGSRMLAPPALRVFGLSFVRLGSLPSRARAGLAATWGNNPDMRRVSKGLRQNPKRIAQLCCSRP